MTKTLVIFLEEPSAQRMFEGFLPKILPNDVEVKYIVFEGKQDLEKQIEGKLRAWRAPLPKFIVLRDQDGGVCTEIKRRLVEKCTQAGHPDTLIRIACHELESWYLGDLLAVERALNLEGLGERQRKQKYRNPDRLANAAQELKKLTQEGYKKISGSRAIGPYLDPDRNQSRSFHVFVEGVRRISGGVTPLGNAREI